MSGPLETLVDALAALANASLSLDPASRARLSALEGRSVGVVAELPAPLPPRPFTLQVEHGRLCLHSRTLEQPNVIVSGSLPDLAQWLLTGATGGRGGLHMDGDTTVLLELAAVFRGFTPDPTGPLGRVLGPETAASLVGAGEMAFAGLRSAAAAVGDSLRQGAAERFVNRQQMDRFLDALDDMKLRMDRLGARVSAEEARRQQS